MSITITGRQFDITPAIKQHVEDSLNAFLADTTLKTSSIQVVMERGKNQFTAGIVLNCKYHVLTAKVARLKKSASDRRKQTKFH